MKIDQNMNKQIDPSLQAAGQQCGIDVEALYKKYSSRDAPTQNDASDATQDGKTTNTDSLDRLQICKQCNGYGLVKEMYHHQIKEVNCGNCEGEGIVEVEGKYKAAI